LACGRLELPEHARTEMTSIEMIKHDIDSVSEKKSVDRVKPTPLGLGYRALYEAGWFYSHVVSQRQRKTHHGDPP
jgi:hypothetical protein